MIQRVHRRLQLRSSWQRWKLLQTAIVAVGLSTLGTAPTALLYTVTTLGPSERIVAHPPQPVATRLISEDKQGMTTVTEQDNGKRIEVAPGETLIVKLESTPGTGYGWQIAKVNPNLLELMGGSTLEESRSSLLGAPAHQVYRFKTRQLGSTELELQYVRIWEKGRAPLKTFNIVVRVLP